ncbi:hypothetical protein HWV62_37617 [Athelia sp. TMB]|nr:hypothetical protein HWV62_37617 [Athelia sp. TMB]
MLLTCLLQELHHITAPFLSSIDISLSSTPEPDFFGLYEIFSGGTPVLDEICFENMSFRHCRPRLASVKALHFRQDKVPDTIVSSDDWLAELTSATSLVHLQLDASMAVTDDWLGSHGGRVKIRCLQSLCIDVNIGVDAQNSTIYPQHFIDRIFTPQLEMLMLKDHMYDLGDWPDFPPDIFPSLHTVIFWKMYLPGWPSDPEESNLCRLLLGHFRQLGIEHAVYHGFGDDDCQRLFSALSLHNREDDSVDDEPKDHRDEDRGGEETEEQKIISFQGQSVSQQFSDGYGALSGPKHSAYLPQLRTIAVMPGARSSTWLTSMPFILDKMRRFLIRRKATTQPIEKLYVPANFLAEVCAEFPAEEGLVGVEAWRPKLLSNWEMWSSYCWDGEY